MKLVKFLFRYSHRTTVLAIVAGVVSGIASTGLIATMNAQLSRTQSRTILIWCFAGLCVLLPVSRFFSEWLLVRLGQDALLELRLQLSRQILAVPLRRLEVLGAHRLLAALTDDVPVITNALLLIPVICVNLAVVIGSLVYLGLLSWPTLLALLVVMAFGVTTYQLAMSRAINYQRRARESMNALFRHFRALTDGTKELKLHRRRREVFLSEVLKETAVSFREENVTSMTIYTAASSWGQSLTFIVIGLIVFALPALYAIEFHRLSGYVFVLLFITGPLQVIMNMMPQMSRANVAVGKVEQLGLTLDGYADAGEEATASILGKTWKSLEVRGVTHNYSVEGEGQNFTLGPINLALHPGELVFIVGGNGSGKTTLAKLLIGLYLPEAGEIRLDGEAITDQNRDGYRQLFSVVFSDFHLFESLLGIERANIDADAQTYLDRLQLSHKVKVVDGKMTTTELSHGQRKRLALLTTYLEDRPIYLFDEWAADQDPGFKEVFYYQLLPELKAKGKTVLVISHDDKYYHVCDRIIKLNYGQIEYDDEFAALQRTTPVSDNGHSEKQPAPSCARALQESQADDPKPVALIASSD